MPVQRIGQSIRLRREYVDEYIKIHSEVWPGVLKRIAGSNIHDYTIFYDKQSSILFATFKYTGTDFDADMKAMAEDEETQRLVSGQVNVILMGVSLSTTTAELSIV